MVTVRSECFYYQRMSQFLCFVLFSEMTHEEYHHIKRELRPSALP